MFVDDIWNQEISIEKPVAIAFGSKEISEENFDAIYALLIKRMELMPDSSPDHNEANRTAEVNLYRHSNNLIEFIYHDPMDLVFNYGDYATIYKVKKIGFGLGDGVQHVIILEHKEIGQDTHTFLFQSQHYDEVVQINKELAKLLKAEKSS